MESDFCADRYALIITFHALGHKHNFQIKMFIIFAYRCHILGFDKHQIR